jgi:DNA-binding response OmpR family regulator
MAKILIAEDDALVAAALEKGFRANGFSTAVVNDGVQAQRLSLTDEFDLLILDLGLPERDGFEVLRALRSRGRTLPVLVLTGRSERDAATCLEAGADDYMRKPFQFEELLARVRIRLLAREELDEMARSLEGVQQPPLSRGAAGGQDPDR